MTTSGAAQKVQPVHVAPDLGEAVEWILADLGEVSIVEPTRRVALTDPPSIFRPWIL